MSERDDLLAAVANTISSYRTAEIVVPTPAHVDTWLNQFTPASQLPFLREFVHVIAQRYLSRAGVTTFLEGLAGNAALVGQDPVDFWRKANVLQIQANGQSQNEMVALLADVLVRRYGVAGHECGREKNVFIYPPRNSPPLLLCTYMTTSARSMGAIPRQKRRHLSSLSR